MTPTAWLWTAIGAVVCGGVLSALVHALTEASRAVLEEMAERRGGPGRRRRIKRILEDSEGHAASIALFRIAFNMLAAAGFTLWVAGLRGVPLPGWTEVGMGIAVSALVVWVFGMVIPTSVARHAGAYAVFSWSGLIRVLYVLGRPLKAVVSFFDEVVRRLAGVSEADRAGEIKQEVLSVLEEGRQEGQVDDSEKDMIEAVVSFRDTTVAQIMTPRTEIEALPLSNDLSQVTAKLRAGGHSRVPVYEGTIDHIVGVFYVKDLMRWLAGEGSRGGRTFNLRSILRPAIFVPESKTVRELLQELLAKRVHIAIVADEFGGTAGLVTFEDIVEEVFGDIQDEYEKPEASVTEVRVEGATADVDARAYIDDVNPELASLGIELPESEDYDTVGGFVTVTLGRIPMPGETMTRDGLKVTVLDAEPTRVKRVRLEAASPRSDEEARRELAQGLADDEEADGATGRATGGVRGGASGRAAEDVGSRDRG